jgi:hypothetical protein
VPRRTQSILDFAATLAAAGALASIMAGASYPAAAQGRPGPASLRQLTQEADAVVRVRVTLATATLEAGGRAYPVVHADVLVTLKGAAAPGAIVFANVGAGAAAFTDGEEVLLFLQHLERIAELAATPLQGRLRYVAIPNAGEKIVLTDAVRPALTDAVRGYAALDTIQDPDARGDALRKLTLEILKSDQPLLVTSTMRDFAPGGDAAALRLADLPAMVPLIESPRVPIGTRIALVAELERRGLIFGPARWVRLLRTSQGSDLLAVLRAVGEHPSAGVAAYLVPLLTQPDLEIATAAATALGVPGNVEAVRPLAVSLGRDDDALRLAALRSLTRIGTQGARQALELVAAKHPDVVLRQRAEIEAVMVARRHGTTLAPTLGFGTFDPALTAPLATSADAP